MVSKTGGGIGTNQYAIKGASKTAPPATAEARARANRLAANARAVAEHGVGIYEDPNGEALYFYDTQDLVDVVTANRAKAPTSLARTGGVMFRGGGQGSMPPGATAADVVAYERNELGNSDITVLATDLDDTAARNLEWVTYDESAAAEYGDVQALHYDAFRPVATDANGGVLIDTSRPSESLPMSEQIAALEQAGRAASELARRGDNATLNTLFNPDPDATSVSWDLFRSDDQRFDGAATFTSPAEALNAASGAGNRTTVHINVTADDRTYPAFIAVPGGPLRVRSAQDEIDPCSQCGDDTSDGEGWDGMCGTCADQRSCPDCGDESPTGENCGCIEAAYEG